MGCEGLHCLGCKEYARNEVAEEFAYGLYCVMATATNHAVGVPRETGQDVDLTSTLSTKLARMGRT